MRCPVQSRENADLLLAYCARKLDAESASLFERHLENCAECRAFTEAQQAVWRALDEWGNIPVAPDFNRRLYARIEAEERRGWWRRVAAQWANSFWLRPAAPVAAMVLAALLIQMPHAPELPSVQVAETVDVDRLERALEDLEMIRQLQLEPRPEVGLSQQM